jgi:hypothetical protein
MGLRRLVVGAALLGLAPQLPVLESAAAEPIPFRPTGGWTADFADESCALERTFSNGTDTLSLRLRQFAPGDAFEITVASPTLGRWRVRRIAFTAAGARQDIEQFQTFEVPGGLKGAIFHASLPSMRPRGEPPPNADFATYTAAAELDRLHIGGLYRSPIDIEMGTLGAAMRTMETCLDDLLAHWGLDAQAHRTLTRRAEPDWSEAWIAVTAPMQRDFLAQKHSTRQDVRLIIDETGKPTGCSVTGWPDDEPIARRMCDALLKEAHIPPALDNRSQPIKSYFVLVLTAIARSG